MIKQTIGPAYQTDESDVSTVKTALNGLGFYKTPSYGLTPYADNALFRAIGDFQQSMGLPATGTMKPDDDTVKALQGAAQDDSTEDIAGRSIPYRCTNPNCGGFHGGGGPSGDNRCQYCREKNPGPGGIYYPADPSDDEPGSDGEDNS